MADDKNKVSKETQKQIEALNDQLNTTLQKVEDVGKSISTNMLNQLIKTTEKTRELADNLSKSKNPTKDLAKINSELTKLNTKNVELSIKKSLAEKALNEAATKYNTTKNIANARALVTAKNDLARITNALKLHQITEDDLRTLLRIAEEEKKIAEQKKKQNSLSGIAKDYYDKNYKSAFSLLGVLTFIGKAILKSDEQTTGLAKSFGVTKGAAKDIRDNMVAFSRASDSSFVNVDRLYKAQQALTEQLGIAVDFGGKEQEQFARLTEIVGLSADEAGKLAKFSAATGMSTDKYVAAIRKSVFFSERTNKLHVSDKQILQDISRLSAGILVKFQNNPEAIAKAVVQAKALGTSLEQVDKVGNSLLDWQSSIQNELEAELITNRKLNFEAARYAALTGNQSELMKEMVKQAGSLAEYQNMNVIAQDSLAKAFGMSRDEMADMLMKQEAINKYGSKAAELNAKQLEDFQKSGMSLDDYLKKQEQQRSIQEKFNDAIAKLQDLIGNLVAGPLGRFLDIIISIAEQTKLLAALASLYITRLITINVLKAREYLISKKTATADAADTAAKTAGSAASMGPLGWVLAGAAALSIYGILSGMLSKADDAVFPGGGYGDRMLFDKGQITALNNNDTVIAGTNLFKGDDTISSPKGAITMPNMNTGLLKQQQRTNELLEQSLSRPAEAFIRGEDPFIDNMSRNPRFGTNQAKQTYGLV